MKRTTIHLPAELRTRAKRCAKERGVTLAELMRAALEKEIGAERGRDPLFRPLEGYQRLPDTPRDLAEKHDEYLYGGR